MRNKSCVPGIPGIPKWLGPLLMAGAVLMALYGKPSPGVPHWIAYLACAAVFLGGVAATAIASGRPEINNYLGPVLIVLLLIIPTWIGFGPGERRCSGGLSFMGFSFWHLAPGTECRVVFGGAAVLLWLGFIVTIVSVLRGKKGN